MRQVCLVGAGFISGVHAEALRRLPGVQIAAIVDPNEEAARRLADKFSVDQAFTSVDRALRTQSFDAAHILVPPTLHDVVAEPLIEAGIATFIEKPIATNSRKAKSLVTKCLENTVTLGVNLNAVYHPAFVRLQQALVAGTIGKPRSAICRYRVPLRQLTAKQFGHWMFQSPQNILLEQAVHPLSQVLSLSGAVKDLHCFAGPPVAIAPDKLFYPTLGAVLACEKFLVEFDFGVGESFPIWQLTVTGDDGLLVADILRNRCHVERRTRWPTPVDNFFSGWSSAGAMLRESHRGLVGDALAILRPNRHGDAYVQSMRASIAAFHKALARGESPEIGANFAVELVATCERIAEVAYQHTSENAPTAIDVAATEEVDADVAVLGGTGFIGRHVVAELVEHGKRVSVMARSISNLPDVFADPRVALVQGDITNAAAVAAAIGNASVVVNLAQGSGAASWEETYRTMVGGAETVARVCCEKQVRRLVYISSIAALYLGPQQTPLTGETPPDPLPEKRSDYARGKGLCERMLLDLRATAGLPVVILRPGIVVGGGGSPFHGGLGFYNNEQHCNGWNDGRNALPFVLVEDVATAIAKACDAAGVDGRAFNLVGRVRLSGRDFVAASAKALQRPLRFHPQSPVRLWLIEQAKSLVKRLSGRRASAPSLRDLRSRGLSAEFDCRDAEAALGWNPVADREAFLAAVFEA